MTLFGYLAIAIGYLIEVFYIGQVGKMELAAYAFAVSVILALTTCTRSMATGAAALIAHTAGSDHAADGKSSEITLAVSHCCLLVIIFTTSVLIMGPLAARSLFTLLGAEGEVLNLVVRYTDIWLLSFPWIGITMVSNSLIRSLGDATFPGLTMFTGTVVQVVVGPFLIFGWAGITPQGLDGVAWAFVVGAALQALLAGWWFLTRLQRLTIRLSGFLKTAQAVLHVAIPAAGAKLIVPLSIVATTWLLAGFGHTIIAAYIVAIRIVEVANMGVVGISTAVIPLVGQNWGAGKFSRVATTLRICYISGHLWGLTAACIMAAFAPFLINLIHPDPHLVSVTTAYLYIVPSSIGFMGMIYISNGAFNAIHQPKPALILSASRLVLVLLPLGLILSRLLGYQGVFAAIALSNLIMGIISSIWCKHRMQREQAKR